MKTVRIFIASSIVEFEQERDKLAARIRALNDKYVHNDIYFQLNLCEDYSHAWTQGRKQEEFNELVRRCDFFFALVGADVGKATLEEIDVAREQLKKSGNALSPKIVVFFRDLPVEEQSPEVIRLKMDIRRGQYPPKFTHASEITRDILLELIDAGAFFAPASLEVGRKTHAELVARIDENRRKIAALGEATTENEAELLLLYRTNVELSRQALSEWETFYDYAWFLHKRNYDEKAIETGMELEDFYTSNDDAGDLADLKKLLGDCYAALERYEEAETYYRATLDIYWKLADTEPDDYGPDVAETCVKLAEILVTTYRFNAGERFYREALGRYLHDWDEYALEIGQVCHALCGLTKQTRDKESVILKKAERVFLKYAWRDVRNGIKAVSAILLHWLKRFPCPDGQVKIKLHVVEESAQTTSSHETNKSAWGKTCLNIAKTLEEHNCMEDAENFAYQALTIFQMLEKENPDSFTSRIATAHAMISMICIRTNRLYKAEAHAKEVLEIMHKSLEENSDVFTECCISEGCYNLANALCEMERFQEAEEYYREALAIQRKWEKKGKNTAQYELIKHELAIFYYGLGRLLFKVWRLQEAEEYLKEALCRIQKLAQKNLDAFGLDLALDYGVLANLFEKTGRLEQANQYFQEAFNIQRHMVKKDSDAFEPYLAEVCYNYGRFLLKKMRNPIFAKECLDEAIAILDDRKYSHYTELLSIAMGMRSECQYAIYSARHGQ